jgi:putative membrane protein
VKPGALIAGLAGLVLVAALLLDRGAGAVWSALSALGFGGFALLIAAHLAAIVPCAVALRCLIEPPAPGLGRILWVRLCRDAAGDLLGFVPAIGDLLAMRALRLLGLAGSAAAAIAVVDLTIELIAQVAFSSLGLALLAALAGGSAPYYGAAGLIVMSAAMAGFVAVQRAGVFGLLERLARRFAHGAGAAVERHLALLWRDRPRVARSFAIHLAAWFVGAAEAWIALHLMGIEVGIATVLAIESAVFALRNVAFVVPGALGIQEGAYLVFAALFGLPGEAVLAVSLAKRGREVAVGLPILLSWQLVERRRQSIGRIMRPSASGPSV